SAAPRCTGSAMTIGSAATATPGRQRSAFTLQTGLLDVVELGEFARQVRIAAVEDRILPAGPDAAAGPLAVLRVPALGDVHALDDLGKRHERFLVVGLAVIAQVDEDLRRAPVGILERIGDRAADVRLAPRIVGNRASAPGLRDRRIGGNPELRPRG